jgi:hypothetical protein
MTAISGVGWGSGPPDMPNRHRSQAGGCTRASRIDDDLGVAREGRRPLASGAAGKEGRGVDHRRCGCGRWGRCWGCGRWSRGDCGGGGGEDEGGAMVKQLVDAYIVPL